jgi:hypothetical protein
VLRYSFKTRKIEDAMTKGALANWLELKFAEWQPAQDRSQRSLTAFAAYLGIKQQLLDTLINGKRTSISAQTADSIAARLGPEIYDLVRLPRPDPDLARIEKLWPFVSEERRAYIVRIAEKAAKDGQTPEAVAQVVAQPRKAGA